MRDKGLSEHESAEQGAEQVWWALLASTATTVAIFLQVFFLKDIEGQLFGDLALTIAIAVSVSLIVAVVLLPVLAKYFLKQQRVNDPNEKPWQRITAFVMACTNTRAKRFSLAVTLLNLSSG